jgi:hypothetical protein
MVPRHCAWRRCVSCRRGAGQGSNREPDGSAGPVSGGGTSGRHGELDAANDSYLPCQELQDWEQLEAPKKDANRELFCLAIKMTTGSR